MQVSFEVGFTIVCVGSGVLFVLILIMPTIAAARRGDKWRKD